MAGSPMARARRCSAETTAASMRRFYPTPLLHWLSARKTAGPVERPAARSGNRRPPTRIPRPRSDMSADPHAGFTDVRAAFEAHMSREFPFAVELSLRPLIDYWQGL